MNPRYRFAAVLLLPLVLLGGLILLSLRPGTQAPVQMTELPEPAEPASPGRDSRDVFTAFTDWLATYSASSPAGREQIEEEGLDLAVQRAGELLTLMETDPGKAISVSLTAREREALPPELREFIERPFSFRSPMDVFPLCSDLESHGLTATPPGAGHQRQGVRIEIRDQRGKTLDTYVSDSRTSPLSRESIALQGIRLRGKAALREEMFLRIAPDEVEETKLRYTQGSTGLTRDFLTGERIGGTPVVALSGGQLYAFSSGAHLERVNAAAARLEENIGMENGSQLLLTARLTLGHDPIDLDAVEEEGEVMASIPSDTTRSAIVILVDFPNNTGTPINPTVLQARFDGEVHDQVASMSFHKTGIDATVDPRVFRLPHPTTYYNGTDDGQKKNGALFDHAIAAANAAGLSTTGYNHRCVIFKGGGMGYCGLATVGGSKIWLPCHGSKVIVHELGHNFGLGHASFWNSTTANPVDPGGSSVEYGDNTSIMGGGGVTSGHFHVQGKRKLNWLESAQQISIGDADSSNIHRIYRFDHEDTDAANQKRAIRVKKGDDEFYWLGYRQRFTGNNFQHYLKGIQVHWEQKGKSKSWLVDTNPVGNKNDSGIPLGRTFSDPVAQIHITPLKRGGSSPNQWIDVQVNVGAFPGNTAPTGQMNLPARYAVNAAVPVGASVTDAEGDELAYFFDFGTGTVVGNDATQNGRNYSWGVTGSQSVTLTATDRKGATFERTATIQIQPALPVPANVTASDRDHFDRVDIAWSAVSGATEYAVYRSATSSAFDATLLGTSGTPGLSDTSIPPGVPRHYFVQALGSGTASPFSASVRGERSEGPPSSPSGLSATQNLFSDRTEIEWSGDGTTETFEILRAPVADVNQADVIGEVTGSPFSDETATAGQVFHYWVRARNAFGSALSDSTGGSRKLPAPEGAQASRGAASSHVLLQWSALQNADSYEIRGGADPESVDTLVGSTTETSFSHSPPLVLQDHYYRIRGIAATGPGDWSPVFSGFRTFAAPTAIAVSVQRFDDRIRLSWEDAVVPQGVGLRYEIWRADAGSPRSEATLVATIDGLSFEDLDALPGKEYSYWIRGIDDDSGVQGEFSAAMTGMRATVPPFQPDQSVGSSAGSQRGIGIYNQSASGQTFVYRMKKVRSAKILSFLANDGLFPDEFKLITTSGDRYFSIRLREQFGDRRIISAASFLGTYRSEPVPETERRLFQLSASPKRAAKTRKVRRSYFLWSVSMTDPDHQDRARASILTPRPRR